MSAERDQERYIKNEFRRGKHRYIIEGNNGTPVVISKEVVKRIRDRKAKEMKRRMQKLTPKQLIRHTIQDSTL